VPKFVGHIGLGAHHPVLGLWARRWYPPPKWPILCRVGR